MYRGYGSFFAFTIALALATSTFSETTPLTQAQLPDLSGAWILDAESSDDTESQIIEGAGENTTHGMTRLERDRLVERLIGLARALNEIDIEQSDRDFKIFDEADNLRIYYFDGEKHARQTPWGAKLETVAKWDGTRLTIRTTGGDLGEVDEIYGMEGRRLVFIVRIRNKSFSREIVIRNYYNRGSNSP